MKLTTVLDILGLLFVSAFAYLIWPPLSLGVVGLAILAASFIRARGGRS